MDERANEITNEGAKLRIWRRIAVKGVVFVVWAIGMLTLALHGDQELSQHTYFYMLFAVLVVGVSLGMLAYGPIDSLLPLMVCSHFGGDGFAASLLAAVMGVGLLVGSVILMVVNPQNKLTRIIVVAAFIVGAGALVSGMIPEDGYWAFVVCIGILAVACAWFNAPLMTLLQRGIPDDKLGRVMGLFSALNGLTIPAGTALGGVIAEVTGTPLFFAIDGTFILLLAVSLALSKNVRKLDSIT